MSLTMVTLTGHYETANEEPETGSVTFTPSVTLQSASNSVIIPSGPVTATLDGNGDFTIQLLATDAAGVSPTGWTYQVVEQLGTQLAQVGRTYSILLPGADSPVDLSSISPVAPSGDLTLFGALAGDNVWTGTNDFTGSVSFTIPAATNSSQGAIQLDGDLGGTATGPQVTGTHLASPLPVAQGGTGASSAPNARTNLGLGTAATQASSAFDAAGSAATAQSNAETYTAAQIASEVSRANSAYDAAGAAATAQSNAEAYTNTQITAEVSRANAAYDAAGAAATALSSAEASAASLYQPIATLATSVPYPPSLRLPRYVQPTAIGTEFQSGHGFVSDVSGSGTYTANDTSVFARGSQCATLTTPGDGVTYHVYGSITAASLASAIPRVTAQVTNINNLASFEIDVCTDTTWTNGWNWTMQTGVSGSNYYTSGDWVTQSLSFHTAVKIGSGATTGLAAVRFRIADIGGGSANAVTVHLQMVDFVASGQATFPNGVISITFDDCYEDALTAGKPYLDLYGYNATSFVIADLIGTTGRLSLTDLRNLQKDSGWEIACHAYSDTVHSETYTGVTAAQLLADATSMKAFAVANGFRGADLVAYPKGQYGQTTDNVNTELILEQVYGFGLTTINKTKETYPPSDAWRVRRISSISSYTGDGQEYLTSLITQTGGDLDQCKATGSWLILAFHEVVSSPSADTQISITDFASIMAGINSHGIPVMPVGEVLRWANTTGTVQATIDTTDLPKRPASPAATGSGPLAAPYDHVHPWADFSPADHGYLTWSDKPTACNSSGTAPTAGQLQLIRVHLPTAATVTNVVVFVQSVTGVSLTTNECFAGLYTSGGTLLSGTADQSTAWTSTGTKVMALTTTQTNLAAGDYYIAFFANGSTLPTFAKAVSGFSIVNTGLTATNSRYATSTGSLTTAMPGTYGTLAGSSNAFWAALS